MSNSSTLLHPKGLRVKPFASNPAFRPTEVLRFIRSFDSGAGAMVVETDAGQAYLKAMGNPGGPHVLACDLVGTHLASSLGMPTFDYALLLVTEVDELPFSRSGLGTALPGPAFATRAEKGNVWGRDSASLKRLANPDDITRLVCMDTWVLNADRYGPCGNRVNADNVFFSMETGDKHFELRAMDFTHAFTNGRELTKRVAHIDNSKNLSVFGLFPEFRKMLRRDVVKSFCKTLEDLPTNIASSAVNLIPKEWQVEPDTRQALIEFINSRARFLAGSLEERLFSPPQLTLPENWEDQS